VPPTLTAPAQDQDVCSLLPANVAGNLLDRDFEIVGVELGAARVPTMRCMLGEEFAVPQLTVELATGPVAASVFEDAYGDAAGGDPVFMRRVGDGAFLRSERGAHILHIYTSGSVLTLTLQTDPTHRVARSKLIALAKLALDRLPENPRLVQGPQEPDCDQIRRSTVAQAVGVAPRAATGLAGPADDLLCSWASRPGSATVTIIRTPSEVAAYRRNLDANLYSEVGDLETTPGLTALSRTDRAGDLLLFDDDVMAVVTVIPSAGFADGGTTTTPGEMSLAHQIIDLL
jgi:hypothetical protein